MINKKELGLLKPHRFILTVSLVLIICSVLIISFCFKTVPFNHKGVVTQDGFIKKISSEGFVFVFPWQNLTFWKLNDLCNTSEYMDATTLNEKPVSGSTHTCYSFTPQKMDELVNRYTEQQNLHYAISDAISLAYLDVLSKYSSFKEVFAKKDEIANAILAKIKVKFEPQGVVFNSLALEDLEASPSYLTAYREVAVQEQLALAAEAKTKKELEEAKQKIIQAKTDLALKQIKSGVESDISLNDNVSITPNFQGKSKHLLEKHYNKTRSIIIPKGSHLKPDLN